MYSDNFLQWSSFNQFNSTISVKLDDMFLSISNAITVKLGDATPPTMNAYFGLQ